MHTPSSEAPGIPASCPAEPGEAVDWALFLDVDGSLIDIADRPDGVVVPAGLPALLGQLGTALDGAVALISGRPLNELDQLFSRSVAAAAGQHGLERRGADGALRDPPPLPDRFEQAAELLRAVAEINDGLLFERKSHGLALHYRGAPPLQPVAQEAAEKAARLTEPGLHLLAGKMVFELRVPGADKGTAVEAFLAEPPFAGRRPVFVGDDVTDEDGFRAVNARGGLSILIGDRPSLATCRLESPAALRGWLADLANRLQESGRDD